MKATILSLALTVGLGSLPAYSQDVGQDVKDAAHDTKTATVKGTKKSTEATKKGVDKTTEATKKGVDKTTEATKKGYKKSTEATKKGINKTADKVAEKTDTSK
jgi:hypothetical protein